ncbi:hypothetical protein PG991_015814 [Apiospora marii]|uniref:NACHT domain-containing protein n=1 Tax=Apiospora marii TaxID=335849 RepID=A0ABR1R4L0_9PEZI
MGLPGERTQPLSADHRHVCKYESPKDPNYASVRNALLATVEAIEKEWSFTQRDERRAQLKSIAHYLSAPMRPEDELAKLDDIKINNSCLWLTNKAKFLDWQSDRYQDALDSGPNIFWLSGKPGCGKSVLTAHVIKYLESCNGDCSYYFFKHNNKEASSASALIRSLACQMAETNPLIRQELLAMVSEAEFLNKNDENSVWKTIFLKRILRLDFHQPHYWIIDALDESPNYESVLQLVTRIQRTLPLKIFITSRPLTLFDRLSNQDRLSFVADFVTKETTTEDIRLFLHANSQLLPVEGEDSRLNLIEKIVEKSNGSFLWASLVSKELEVTYSEQHINDVLAQVPVEMDGLYVRILDGVQAVPRNQSLARAIFRWTVCAARPMSIQELKDALTLDTGHVIPRLESVIGSITGHLVDVGVDNRVQLVHETFKAFLTRQASATEFVIERRKEHASIAEICLKYLCGEEFQSFRSRKGSVSKSIVVSPRLAFTNYAAFHFSQHIAESSSAIDSLLIHLNEFLRTNVLGWIEYVARENRISALLQTSKHLKAYLERRAKYRSPLGVEVQYVNAWADDMIRIVAAFGRNITSFPQSIHTLVPPLCPLNSMIYRDHRHASKSLEVVGVSDQEWDDLISCMVYPEGQALSVTSQESRYAVGLSTGKIHLYKTGTFEEARILDHVEPVRHLCFAGGSELLASSGRKHLNLWDPQTGARLWTASIKNLVLSISFNQTDTAVLLATRGNKLASFDAQNGNPSDEAAFFDMDEREDKNIINKRPPTHVSFCSELNLLGVAYRQRPISFWDLEDNSWLGHFHKGDSDVYPGPLLVGLVINLNPELELAAASYQDGDLVIFNPFDGQQQAVVETSAMAIAFTSDSTRFFDIRGNQCNVWEPTVLMRNGEPDDSMSEPISDEIPHPALLVDYKTLSEDLTITAVCEHPSGRWVLGGRESGALSVFDITTGTEAQQLLKPSVISVKSIAWSTPHDYLSVSDSSGRFNVRRVTVTPEGTWTVEEPLLSKRADRPIRQLLFDPSGTRLLVSTDTIDEIWNIAEAKVVHSVTRHNSTTWRWLNDPLCGDELLLIEPNLAHVFAWKDFERLSGANGIELPGSGTAELTLNNVISSRSGRNLCVRLLKPSDSSFPGLQVYLASGINSKATSASPVAAYRTLAGRVKAIVGVHRSSLVFLDIDGWICSLDIDSFAVETHYSRHFFIPLSWYNVGELHFVVTSQGAVALARRDEVVIFHHGLDFFEERIALDIQKDNITPLVGDKGGISGGIKISRRRRPGARTIRSDPGPV